MWKVQCLCTSNGGTCSTVSHVSAVLIYVCLSHCILEESFFSYWTEICSGTTSNRVSKVKCLSFLWQLLSDLWCQHTLHKHLWISSSLRAPWMEACPITSSCCRLCHCKTSHCCSLSQHAATFLLMCSWEQSALYGLPNCSCIPAFPGQSPLHAMWLCHCYLCFNGVILLLRKRKGGMTLWFVGGAFEFNLLQ